MSYDDGIIDGGGKKRNFWKIPKDGDVKNGLFYCKQMDRNARALAGRLSFVEPKEFEFENDTHYTLVIGLEVGEVINVIETGRYTFAGRDIINRLANTDETYVMITPYVSEDDKGKTYTRVSVRAASNMDELSQEINKVKPKYSHEEIPKPKEHRMGNKKVLDTEARDKFFDNLIDEVSKRLKGKKVPEPVYEDEVDF